MSKFLICAITRPGLGDAGLGLDREDSRSNSRWRGAIEGRWKRAFARVIKEGEPEEQSGHELSEFEPEFDSPVTDTVTAVRVSGTGFVSVA